MRLEHDCKNNRKQNASRRNFGDYMKIRIEVYATKMFAIKKFVYFDYNAFMHVVVLFHNHAMQYLI